MGFMKNLMIKVHRRSGDHFSGMDLLYLTTIGAKSGEKRLSPLARFPDGDGWLVVASNGGKPRHPNWYYNVRAHPDQVWIEMGGNTVPATAEELDGPRRAEAWERIVASQPRFASYGDKTSRALPVIRLSPR